MSDPHRMTLRPPWEKQALPDGRTRHHRRFGRPRTVDDHETVWLVGEASGEVLLNGELLGACDGRFAFEVTNRLNPRNEVAVDTAGEPGPVAVEVRAAPPPAGP